MVQYATFDLSIVHAQKNMKYHFLIQGGERFCHVDPERKISSLGTSSSGQTNKRGQGEESSNGPPSNNHRQGAKQDGD